jgi:hypothetical protein
MTQTRCALCGGPVADPPTPRSRIVRVEGKTGCLVLADAEYPLHRCETLDPVEEQDLLRQAGELFNNEHLKDLPGYK